MSAGRMGILGSSWPVAALMAAATAAEEEMVGAWWYSTLEGGYRRVSVVRGC